MRSMKSLTVLVATSLAVAVSTATPAAAHTVGSGTIARPRTLATFTEAPLGEWGYDFAESLAIDRRGAEYVATTTFGALSNTCRVVRIGANGAKSQFGPALDDLCAVGVLAGLAFDEHGKLYAAVGTFSEDPAPGVFRLDADHWTRVLTIPGGFPNGLAVHRGYLYASDSAGTGIWRVRLNGGVAPSNPWVQSPLFASDEGLGANGLAFRGNTLYVAVAHPSGYHGGRIVRVSVSSGGSAGTPTVMAQSPRLFAVDGIAFDALGGLWAVTNGDWSSCTGTVPCAGTGQSLLVLTPHGRLLTLATDAPWMNYPTMIAFGTTHSTRTTVFVTDGNFLNFSRPSAQLLAMKVGVPGAPLL